MGGAVWKPYKISKDYMKNITLETNYYNGNEGYCGNLSRNYKNYKVNIFYYVGLPVSPGVDRFY